MRRGVKEYKKGATKAKEKKRKSEKQASVPSKRTRSPEDRDPVLPPVLVDSLYLMCLPRAYTR